MPKSNSSTTAAQNKPPSPFVNYDLTKEDKENLSKLKPTWETVSKEISQLTKEGYKLTLAWDAYSDCLACWLIGGRETANEGLILPSRANDPLKAIASVVFKHKAVFEGVWRQRILDGRPSDDY